MGVGLGSRGQWGWVRATLRAEKHRKALGLEGHTLLSHALLIGLTPAGDAFAGGRGRRGSL